MNYPIVVALTMASMAPFHSALADDHSNQPAACPAAPVRIAAQIATEIASTGHASPVLAFRRGTADLTVDSKRQLVELARMLRDDDELRIEVGFIANEREDGAAAEKLALARSKVVRSKLLALDARAVQVATRSYSRQTAAATVDSNLAENLTRQCSAQVQLSPS